MTISRVLSSLITYHQNQFYDPATGKRLDLAYVLPNVIVASGPIDDHFHKRYRPNRLEDFIRFLDRSHGAGNWKLYNLRAEKIGYDHVANALNMSHYQMVDHEAPQFRTILCALEDLHAWLNGTGSEDHVAVIHCKAGKGRSGTLACCYLMSTDSLITPNRANEIFSKARFVEGVVGPHYGISIVSQRRYVNYYYQYLVSSSLRKRVDFFIRDEKKALETKIISIKLSNPLDPAIKVNVSHYDGDKLYQGHRWASPAEVSANCIQFTEEYVTSHSDLRFAFEYLLLDLTMGLKIPASFNFFWFNSVLELYSRKYLCGVEVNPIYTDTGLAVMQTSKTLGWDEIDGFIGSNQRGFKLFESVEIVYQISFALDGEDEPQDSRYVDTCNSLSPKAKHHHHLSRMFSGRRKAAGEESL